MSGILGTIHNEVCESMERLKERISNVRYGEIINGQDVIRFKLDEEEYLSPLKGRNKDVVLGHGEKKDKAIAVRAFLDGHARKDGMV